MNKTCVSLRIPLKFPWHLCTYTTATCTVATTRLHAFTTRAVIQYLLHAFTTFAVANYLRATTGLYKIYSQVFTTGHSQVLVSATTRVVTRKHYL